MNDKVPMIESTKMVPNVYLLSLNKFENLPISDSFSLHVIKIIRK